MQGLCILLLYIVLHEKVCEKIKNALSKPRTGVSVVNYQLSVWYV